VRPFLQSASFTLDSGSEGLVTSRRVQDVYCRWQAAMEASRAMLDQAERTFAVWDGKPARGYGGTADVVAEARDRGTPVTVIWPEGATRDQAA
jgi:hypothetical protein